MLVLFVFVSCDDRDDADSFPVVDYTSLKSSDGYRIPKGTDALHVLNCFYSEFGYGDFEVSGKYEKTETAVLNGKEYSDTLSKDIIGIKVWHVDNSTKGNRVSSFFVEFITTDDEPILLRYKWQYNNTNAWYNDKTDGEITLSFLNTITLNDSDGGGGNMIDRNFEIYESYNTKDTATSGEISNIKDSDKNTYRQVSTYREHYSSIDINTTYKISGNFGVVTTVYIKFNVLQRFGFDTKAFVIKYVKKNGKEVIIDKPTLYSGDSYSVDKEFDIYDSDIDYFVVNFTATVRSNTSSISTSFYDFTVHTAPEGQLTFKDGSGRTWRLADWDEGYTPLQYCGTDGNAHCVLLVSPGRAVASPLRIALADGSSAFPSERIREFAVSHGSADGIMAAAGRLS